MKLINGNTLLFLTATVFLSGCLKDKAFDNSEIQSLRSNNNPKVVSVGLTASDTTNFATVAANAVSTETEVDVVPIFSSVKTTSDVNVTITLDSTLVDEYNLNNGTGYTIPPPGSYTIVNPVVTIRSGSNVAYVKVKFIPLDYLGLDYALGFRITSVDKSDYMISSNLGKGVAALTAKNKYEALYDVTGYVFHPTVPRSINRVKPVSTVSDITCEVQAADLAGYYFDFDVNSSNQLDNWVAQGSMPPAPKSGFMTMDNPGGFSYSPVIPGTAPWISTTYNNSYDPSTQTFWMHYGYHSTGNGEATFTRQIYEKWVRK